MLLGALSRLGESQPAPVALVEVTPHGIPPQESAQYALTVRAPSDAFDDLASFWVASVIQANPELSRDRIRELLADATCELIGEPQLRDLKSRLGTTVSGLFPEIKDGITEAYLMSNQWDDVSVLLVGTEDFAAFFWWTTA